MRSHHLTTLAALASTLLPSTTAINLIKPRSGQAPRVVEHALQRRHIANPLEHDRLRHAARDLRKRADTVSVPLTNEETLYFMDMTIGTPAQKFRMHIDTGSSDLWVNVDSSRLCSENSDPCEAGGTYNANASSTYQYVNSDFNITYVDGTGSSGDYVEDTVRFEGVTLRNQQFGVGYSSTTIEGILGIGYELNEVAVEYTQRTYPNVPANLVNKGYINTNAYSLWLNDLDANTGSILFGGVDTDKYTGELETVPIIPIEGRAYAEFVIALTAVGNNGNANSIVSNAAYGALLDSGTSLMYLPDSITSSIFSAVGAQYDSNQGAAFVDCSLAKQSGSIDFTFSSPTIKVPYNELVIVAGEQNGQEICILGIAPSGSDQVVLGDTFLRSAYVVYDLENNEISIAQTDYNATSSNIKEIQSGESVPSATTVNNAVTSVVSASESARIGSPGIGIGSFSSSSVAGAVPTAAVGLGYQIALVGAAGAAMLAL